MIWGLWYARMTGMCTVHRYCCVSDINCGYMLYTSVIMFYTEVIVLYIMVIMLYSAFSVIYCGYNAWKSAEVSAWCCQTAWRGSAAASSGLRTHSGKSQGIQESAKICSSYWHFSEILAACRKPSACVSGLFCNQRLTGLPKPEFGPFG